jgi:hypothetical protein
MTSFFGLERDEQFARRLLLMPIDQLFCFVRRHSRWAKQKIAPKDAVNLDLPVIANVMGSVRRHDLDLATLVSELGRRGHSAVWFDVEIWRVFRHHDLLLPKWSLFADSPNFIESCLCI